MSNRFDLTYPFNTPLESGMRSLFILAAVHPSSCDIQRLTYFDYLVVHSGDVEDGPSSMHPPTPHRSGELLVRRELIGLGIKLMVSRELINPQYTSGGVAFEISDIGMNLIGYFDSPYAKELAVRAGWLGRSFGELSDERLQAYIRENVGRWGAEFSNEAVLRYEAE